MNKCPRCSTYVPVEQSFCQNCGASMSEQPETTAQRGNSTAPNNLAETIAVPPGAFNVPTSNPSIPPPPPAYAPTQYSPNPSTYPAAPPPAPYPATGTQSYPPPAPTSQNSYQAAPQQQHQTDAPNYNPLPQGNFADQTPRKSRTGLYIGLGIGAVVLLGIVASVILIAVLALNSSANNNTPNVNNTNISRNQNAANTANANQSNRNGASTSNSGGRNDEDADSVNDQPISDRK